MVSNLKNLLACVFVLACQIYDARDGLHAVSRGQKKGRTAEVARMLRGFRSIEPTKPLHPGGRDCEWKYKVNGFNVCRAYFCVVFAISDHMIREAMKLAKNEKKDLSRASADVVHPNSTMKATLAVAFIKWLAEWCGADQLPADEGIERLRAKGPLSDSDLSSHDDHDLEEAAGGSEAEKASADSLGQLRLPYHTSTAL